MANYHIKLYGSKEGLIFDCEVHAPLVRMVKKPGTFLWHEVRAFFKAVDLNTEEHGRMTDNDHT